MRFRHWLYLIVGVLGVLAMGALAASAVDIPGDLTINSGQHYILSNGDLNVAGNVTVQSGGWLDLTNIDLVIKCTSDGQYTIKVDAGAKYTHDGGSIKSSDPNDRYKFEIRGTATLEGLSSIRDTWGQGAPFDASTGAEPDLANLKGGVQIYSNSVYIGNCTLESGLLCMVYVNGCSPTIYGNTFRDVAYNVKQYSQSPSNPSSTRWSAMAFGVLLDNSVNAKVDSNTFTGIGSFSTITNTFYRDTATSNNYYQVIAAGIASRASTIKHDSNTIKLTGVLAKASDTFQDGGNTVNQYFYQYMVSGIYAYRSFGASLQGNIVSNSSWGMYITVDNGAAGGAMTFDVIVDNVLQHNAAGGAYFGLRSVKRAVTINVSDDDISANGVAPTTVYDDCGVVVSAQDGTADLKVIMQLDIIKANIGRGVYVDVKNHHAALTVEATNSNVFQGNGLAGLKVGMDIVTGNVRVEVTNTSFTQNKPAAIDAGALSVEGGALSAAFTVKMADVTATFNTGHGAAVAIGYGMSSVDNANPTTYTVQNCQFDDNSGYGLLIFDNYGTNGQQTTVNWAGVQASRDLMGIYVHSHATLGSVKLNAVDVTAEDDGQMDTAIRVELRAAKLTSVFKNLLITYSAGDAPNAVGLSLQGTDVNSRMDVSIVDSVCLHAGTVLEVQNCNVVARNCNLTGVGVNSITAMDSRVDLYDCRVPELSAQTQGTTVNTGVYFYRWFNISKVSWQNGQPIRNQTITIKRYREPKDDVYTAQTDAKGQLKYAQIPYWVKDDINNPLRNDELQAFMKLRNDELNSLSFSFNVSLVGIEDPRVPDLIISTPANKTVQKIGTISIQGEIRDAHSGVERVEATIDNIVWWNATGLEGQEGKVAASFQINIPGLTDNVYQIKVRGWDVARYPNESMGVALVNIVDVRIDTQPPFLQLENPPFEHYVTNVANITIVGRTEPSANIRRLTINDVPVDIAGITFEYDTNLTEGSNTFIIIVEDTAGNIAVATRQIVLDTLPPTLIVTSPGEGFSSREQAFEISGDSEQTATVYVKLDARAEEKVTNRGGTRFYHVITITKEGMHSITVRAEDAAGNVMTRTVHVKYDITPPIIEMEAPTKGVITNVQTVYVAGHTDPEVQQVVVNGLYFPVINGLFSLEINLLEGNQTLKVEVKDAAGNANSTSVPMTIDVTAPQMIGLTIQSSEAGAISQKLENDMVINKRSVRFSGRLELPDWRGLYIRVGNDNRTALWDEAGFFYRDFNLDEGENTVVLFAVDIAGNKETLAYNVIVDTRPPNVRFFSPKMSPTLESKVQDDTVVVSGVVEEEGVTLLINSRPVPVVPKTGTFQTTVPLSLGLNNIEVSYSDKAGNSGSDILKVTYEKSSAKANPTMSALGSMWWLFAIAIAVLIILPIMVSMTRSRWVKQHPELENYDPKAAKEAYAEEEYYDDPLARRGGGL